MKTKGFTLVEMLVVATLIGLLSTVGMIGYQAIIRKGRDALRKSELEQIRSALEIYKSENGSYPVNSSALVPDYIASFPTDPKSPTMNYSYRRITSITYQLCAHLENGDTSTDGCGGGNNCVLNCNYQLTNP